MLMIQIVLKTEKNRIQYSGISKLLNSTLYVWLLLHVNVKYFFNNSGVSKGETVTLKTQKQKLWD